jgi:hypothetical protein
MELQTHSEWLRTFGFRAIADKMSFRIMDPHNEGEITSIDISIQQNAAAPGSSYAEPPGWIVDVRYTNAPSIILFTQTYPTRDLAEKVMSDLSKPANDAQALIRKGDFEGAMEKTKILMDYFKSNTGQPPVEELGGFK